VNNQPEVMERNQLTTLSKIQKRIQDSVALMAGRLNVSARAAASEPMHQFWSELISVGSALHALYPDFQASNISTFSAATVSASLIEQAKNLFRREMESVAETMRFVNICVDSGTVLRFCAVHSVLTNPNYEFTRHFETLEKGDLGADGYAAFFRETVKEVREYHLEVCGIVIDNCPAQVKGLRQFIDEDKQGIIHVPCFCHMANLVFAHTVKRPEFSDVMKQIKNLVDQFRSKDACVNMRGRCPAISETRWCYLENCLHWLLVRKEAVNITLVGLGKSEMGVEIDIVYRVFLPLKLFCQAAESNTTTLADVLEMVEEAMVEWSNVLDWISQLDGSGRRFGMWMINCVTSHFSVRLKRNAWDDVITAFCLTPLGRYCIRLRNRGWIGRGGLVRPPDNLVNLWGKRMAKRFRGLMKVIGEELLIFDIAHGPREDGVVAELEHEGTDEWGRVIGEEEGPDEGITQQPKFRELVEEEEKRSLRDRLSSLQFFSGAQGGGIDIKIAQKRVRDMQRAMGLMGKDGEETDFGQLLETWLFDLPMTNGNQFNDKQDCWKANEYWRTVFRDHGEPWVGFCKVVMHFVTLGTSEAEVERTLRQQKDIQGRYGTNYGTDTLDARITLRSLSALDGTGHS
jgi:hypothetical protein